MANEPAKAATDALIAGDELLAMGDIGPCELVEGRIVQTIPTSFEHGAYGTNFSAILNTRVF